MSKTKMLHSNYLTERTLYLFPLRRFPGKIPFLHTELVNEGAGVLILLPRHGHVVKHLPSDTLPAHHKA